MENKYLIGIDIGGSTFSSALFTEKLKIVSKSEKNHISNFHSTETLINGLVQQINQISENKNIYGIGISCPGPLIAKTGIILETRNLTLLQNCNIKAEMENRLNCPCLIENDANLFALGEYKNYNNSKDVFLGITLGTGLGFGLIINGELFTGGNNMATEYGISPINNSNWENKISIHRVKNQINQDYKKTLDPVILSKLAQENDKIALKICKDFGTDLGSCLSHVINFIDPNAISIGGGLSHAFPYFEEEMKIIKENCID